jgi:hypothetical protein
MGLQFKILTEYADAITIENLHVQYDLLLFKKKG